MYKVSCKLHDVNPVKWVIEACSLHLFHYKVLEVR